MSETWHADIGRPLTAEEEAAERARREEIRTAREAEETRQHGEAREKAAAIWRAATPATNDHSYLARKGVSAYGVRVDADGFTFAQRRELVTRNPAAVAERCRLNADEVAMEMQPDTDTGGY